MSGGGDFFRHANLEPYVPRHLEEMLAALRSGAKDPREIDGARWAEVSMSQEELAGAIRRSDRQARRDVRELVELDFLRIVRRGGRQQGATTYLVRLSIELPAGPDWSAVAERAAESAAEFDRQWLAQQREGEDD